MLFFTENQIEPDCQVKRSSIIYISCRKTNSSYIKCWISTETSDFTKCEEYANLFEDDVSEINIEHPNGSVMTIHIQNGLYSIGIIDESEGIIHYYDNKEKKEGVVELNGKTFPIHMISNSKERAYVIIMDFVQTGIPSKTVCWIEEDF